MIEYSDSYQQQIQEQTRRLEVNGWLVRLGEAVCLDGFVVTVSLDQFMLGAVETGDGVILGQLINGVWMSVGVGRIYRIRHEEKVAKLYLDAFVLAETQIPLEDHGIRTTENSSPVTRVDWTVFEQIAAATIGREWQSLPGIEGNSPEEQAFLRELYQLAIMDDLLGPADGPNEEIVGMSVRDRYLVGKLAPQNNVIDEDDNLPGEGGEGDQDGPAEVDASTNQSLVPSSFGFTFCVDSNAKEIVIEASWGRYVRGESKQMKEGTGKSHRCWGRIPSGGSQIITVETGKISPVVVDAATPDVLIQGSVSEPLANGDQLVTLFLINNQESPEQNRDAAWLFQPKMTVRDTEGKPIFRRRPIMQTGGIDLEREALEMIYRKQVEFAVGHGVSVHAIAPDDDPEHAIEVSTSILPEYEVPITETPGLAEDDRPAMKKMIEHGFFDMEMLATLEVDDLVAGLQILTNDYAQWIEEQCQRIGVDVHGFDETAKGAMQRCGDVLTRLNEGISVLQSDPLALEAFRFANRTMALQRIRSIYALNVRRGEKCSLADISVRKNRSWRPFQLAFVLLSLPAMTDPEHHDRTEPLDAHADLLWFPTGGGKTEAYLGVAAFTMAIRRLKSDLGGLDGGRGLAVIMRYTLRLLTIQQFQRATTLICAMESLRRQEEGTWGTTPFTIGLWVGNRVTPGTTEQSHVAIQNIRDGQRLGSNSPAQLTTCPWCGAEIADGRDIDVNRDIGRTIIYCGDKMGRCEFSRNKSPGEGIPVVVVDEEIYHRPPTMLIATVDKFAMMAWRGQVRTLFGKATLECDRHGLLWPDSECNGNHNAKGNLPKTTVKAITPLRPPDLIIQDEFHLISGPLGTMVGLYETAVDDLATWAIGNKAIRPKIVASTATVRKAHEQVNNVFLRRVSVFPPHGLDVEDNFFSVQRPIEHRPGRRYMGICSPGTSRPAVLIRVYVALLTASQALFERFGHAADPYMTVVGYFNSLRELGGMRRLAEDDVQTRAYRVQMSNVYRSGLAQRSVRVVDELTSRVSSKDIPRKLDQLEVPFNVTQENDKYVSRWKRGETRAIDIVLATNMLSVGVDVNRLGVMAVNGQPKNTAEYIQATSRVGRVFPGLVCTVLTWARPRDLSHYETFEHYHATFYKHVEAQSVTPFAPRALDRGLTGAMISMLRLGDEQLNSNLGAMEIEDAASRILPTAKDEIIGRAWKATGKKSASDEAEVMIADRIDQWCREASKQGRRLGYETQRRQGDVAALLKRPGIAAWDEFTVPMSMREVEPGVRLIMDDSSLSDSPTWKLPKRNIKGDEA